MQNLSARKLIEFITNDFEVAWNAIASIKELSLGRGNFMFAKQAMVFFELACRICEKDETGNSLKQLGNELFQKNKLYGLQLPKYKEFEHKRWSFNIPGLGPLPHSSQLISVLFDLIRNGQSHLYQQKIVDLEDRNQFTVSLTGPEYGHTIEKSREIKAEEHLKINNPKGTEMLILKVRTDILYLDIKDSVIAANLSSGELDYFKTMYEQVTRDKLCEVFKNGISATYT